MLSFSLTAACSSAAPELAPPDAPADAQAPIDDAQPGVDAQATDGGQDSSDGHEGERDAIRPDAGSDVATDSSEGGLDVVDAARTILCVRLRDPARPNAITQLAEQVDKDYVTRVYRDCDVAKMARTDLDTIFEFYNDLLLFSLDLWGCTERPVTTFGIVRTQVVTELTSADARRLVEHYVAAAMSLLRLDTGEAGQLRQDLTRLSALAITRPSDEFALSVCGAEAGADAGAAEAGASDASDGGYTPDAADDTGGSE